MVIVQKKVLIWYGTPDFTKRVLLEQSGFTKRVLLVQSDFTKRDLLSKFSELARKLCFLRYSRFKTAKIKLEEGN